MACLAPFRPQNGLAQSLQNPFAGRLGKEEFMEASCTSALIDRSQRVAMKVVRQFRSLDERDAMSEAYLGLVEASTRHQPERKQDLWSYAFMRVRGRVLDQVRRNMRERRHFNPQTTYDELQWEGSCEGRCTAVNPALAPSDANGNAYSASSMESCFARRHIAKELASMLAALEPGQRHIVVEVLVRQRTLVEVAEELDMVPWRVQTILNQTVRRMKKELARKGYTVAAVFG